MMFSARQIVGFGLVSAAVLVAAVALPSPYPEQVGVDPRTGAPLRPAAHRLEMLRRSGDARTTRDAIAAVEEPPAAWTRVRVLLDDELDPLGLADLTVDLDGDLDALLATIAAAAGEPDLGRRTESLFRGVSVGAGRQLGLDGRADALSRGLASLAPGERAGACRRQALAFARAGRSRAELRWLLRAIDADPTDREATDRIVAILLAAGQVEAAFALHGAAPGRDSDPDHWRRRAELARWLGRLDDEAVALERHLRNRPDDSPARRRLLAVHAARDDPAAALPQVEALGALAAELRQLASDAAACVVRGDIEGALERFERAAVRSPEPARWQHRIADLALRDLRVERAVDALRAALAADPADDRTQRRLEDLYRRLDRRAELADQLTMRLAANPADGGLRRELIALRQSLGQRITAARLAAENLPAALASPTASGPPVVGPEVPDGDPVVGSLFADIAPLLDDRAVAAAAGQLVERFPTSPGARDLALRLVDLEPTPAARATAAQRVAALWPADPVVIRAAADRAAWAGDVDAELAARRRLADVAPDDRDNRRALAGLLDFRGDHAAAEPLWSALVGGDPASIDAPGWIACQLRLGRSGAAEEFAGRMEAAGATAERRLAAASALGAHGRFAAALPLLAKVVAERPADARALWLLGRAERETGRPDRARATFERRLAASDADRGSVLDELAECHWELGDADRARSLHAAAVDALARDESIDAARRRARALVRLDRHAEADAAFRRLRAGDDDVHLALDHAEVLLALDDRAGVLALVDEQVAVTPDHPRLLAAAPSLRAAAGDLVGAERALGRAIEALGPSAARHAARGDLRRQLDDRRGALADAEARLALEPDDRDAVVGRAQLWDLLADGAVVRTSHRRLGDDRVTTLAASVSTALDADRDRSWLHARIEFGGYRGEAIGPTGPTTVDEELVRVDVGYEQRLSRGVHAGFGLFGLLGASGDLPVGGFAALSRSGGTPFRRLEVRAFVAEPWTDPAAAIALGGRQHGVEATGYLELGDDGYWASGGVRAAFASLDDAFGRELGDGLFRAEIALGKRLFGRSAAVAAPVRFASVPAAPVSPVLATEPLDGERFGASVWLALQSQRLGGSGELESVLPLVDAEEFALLSGRFDAHLERGLGAFVGGFGGAALNDGAGIWNLAAGATWRPADALEITGTLDAGAVLGRERGDTALTASLQAVWRW